MATMWIFNGVTDQWESLSIGGTEGFITWAEAEDQFINHSEGSVLFAANSHTHTGTYLRPSDVLGDGTNIVVTNNGNGTITLSTPTADEILIGTSGPGAIGEGYELYIDTQGAGALQGMPLAGTGGASDHSELTGLGNDDHLHYLTEGRADAQYLRSDGSGGITTVPTADNHVANKKYVDDAINAKVVVSDNPASGVRPQGTVWIEY